MNFLFVIGMGAPNKTVGFHFFGLLADFDGLSQCRSIGQGF